MIIQCQSCAAKYFLPEEKVPVNPLKVRCPKCRAVFMLAGKRDRVEVGAGVAAAPQPRVAPMAATDAPVAPAAVASPRPADLGNDDAPAPTTMTASAPMEGLTTDSHFAAATKPAPAPVETPAPAPVEKPAAAPVASEPVSEPAKAEAPAKSAEPKARGGKSADDRAKRLARVLVSDILWYNRERRDEALRDGTLMTSLGEEIKKSWELYKEKVGPEAAHSTNYFKEALNEILADGQQVF